MCNVCVANSLINGDIIKVQSLTDKDVIYEMRGDSEGAEFKPCSYQLRKNGGEWGIKNFSNDLAGVVSSGGFDLSFRSRSQSQDEWIEKHFK